MSDYQEPDNGYSRKPLRDAAGNPIGQHDVIHMGGPEAITVNAPGEHAGLAAARYSTEDVWRLQGITTDAAIVVAETSPADATYVAAESWGDNPLAFDHNDNIATTAGAGDDDGL